MVQKRLMQVDAETGELIEEGFVAVTPLQLDLTHYSTIGILADRFAD